MSDRQITVRPANHHDIYALTVEMERLAPKDVDWNVPPPDYAHVLGYTLVLARQNRVGVASLPNGQAIGIIAIDIFNWPWNPSAHYCENVHFWVHPDHRKSGAAIQLATWYKEYAQSIGLPARFTVTFDNPADGEFKERFIRMQGFKKIGGNFIFEPKGA